MIGGGQLLSDIDAAAGRIYDVFISHASEDKAGFVEPLARALEARGLTVWYDDFVLQIGDSITNAIETGLSNSLYGIFVISKSSLQKAWPTREINAMIMGHKTVLPIWHGVSSEHIAKYRPLLLDIKAVNSNAGVDHVADQILIAVKPNVIEQKRSVAEMLSNLSELINDYLSATLQVEQRSDWEFQRHVIERSMQALKLLSHAQLKLATADQISEVMESIRAAEAIVSDVMTFYDVKTRSKSRLRVIEIRRIDVNGNARYIVLARTKDGRRVTKFISADNYNRIQQE